MERDDNELVSQTLAGRTEAYGTLVRKYEKVIFNVGYRMTADYDEAQDIAQAAFVKAYENLKRFKPEYRFFSWLYRIAVNESLNRIQAAKKTAHLNPDMASTARGPDEAYGESELGQKVQGALMELKPDHRMVIVLRHFREMSYREIAEALGVPEKRVRSRLFEARRSMRVALAARGVVGSE
jgi:RNA polymerase sigma-70 factor (ECF subfamily)